MPNFLLFLAASMAITVAPGPDNLQVLARGISQGRAAGLVAALGFAAGISFHTALAAWRGSVAQVFSSGLRSGQAGRRCVFGLDRDQGDSQQGVVERARAA